RRADARPIHSVIIVDESQRTRTILYDLTGSAGADPDLPSADVIRSAKVLFVDHYGIERKVRAGRIARTPGIPVVAGFERNEPPRFAILLDLVDHLIVAGEFAARLTGTSDLPGAVERLWSDARQVVIITCGEQGCWYRGPDTSTSARRHPAFPVPAVDTT